MALNVEADYMERSGNSVVTEATLCTLCLRYICVLTV